MEHLREFQDYHAKNNLHINEEYTFKEDSGSGKATWILTLDQKTYDKVKHLFDTDGRPKSDEVKRIKAEGYVWDLYIQQYKASQGEMFKVYGVCGDYTFGNAPVYFKQRNRGNKKAAKVVLDHFIEKFLN